MADATGLDDCEPDEHLSSAQEGNESEFEAELSDIRVISEPQISVHVPAARASRRLHIPLFLGSFGVLLLICISLAYYIGYRQSSVSATGGKLLLVKQLTFRLGSIRGARFRPDGDNVVYESDWEDSHAAELYEISLERTESSLLHSSGALLLGISRSSTLAILLNPQFRGPLSQLGTLAIQGIYENSPHILLQGVGWADWSPDGSTLYYTINENHGATSIGAYSLETHQTRRIYPAVPVRDQWYSHIRVSPQGDAVAFEQHNDMGLSGQVVVLRLANGAQKTSRYYSNLAGLAWRPNGKEVWFTGTEKGRIRCIYAIETSGDERLVYQALMALTLQDISKTGDVLVTRDFATSDVFAKKIGGALQKDTLKDINLSIFDWSELGDISDDGNKVVLLESHDATSKPSLYLRDTTGGTARNLGEAVGPVSISPDGTSVLALSNETCPRVVLLSTEQQPQILTRTNLCVNRAIWVPDGHRMIFDAAEPGHKPQCFSQTIGKADVHPFTIESTHCYLVSPDGQYALAQNGGMFYKTAIDGSQAPVKINIPSGSMARPIRWLPNNKIVVNDGTVLTFTTIDLATGQTSTTPITMPDLLESIYEIKVSADLKTISYSGYKLRSDLFMIRGLR